MGTRPHLADLESVHIDMLACLPGLDVKSSTRTDHTTQNAPVRYTMSMDGDIRSAATLLNVLNIIVANGEAPPSVTRACPALTGLAKS